MNFGESEFFTSKSLDFVPVRHPFLCPLDALFLDESFSTLDADTLNVAIDALQSLQEGDRISSISRGGIQSFPLSDLQYWSSIAASH